MKTLYAITMLTVLLALTIVATPAAPKTYECVVLTARGSDPTATEKLLDKYFSEEFTVGVTSGIVRGDSSHSGFEPFDLQRSLDVLSWGDENEPWQGADGDTYLQIDSFVDENHVPFTFELGAGKKVSGYCLRIYI